MSILFIAVQCFNCSTMQVKQQKKSSNKWVCVICGEKQSVRQIHARGYKAKDVRGFVQGFNSSRSAAGGGGGSEGSGWMSPLRPEISERLEGGGEKKRRDWSEYLDVEEREEEEKEEGGECSGLVVTTELPQEKFRRIFPKRPSKLHQNQPVDGNRNLKPIFSKKRHNESLQGNNGSAKCQRAAIERGSSKWSNYLEEEEGKGVGSKFDRNDSELLDVKENMFNDFIVEEEVHPDFI
ncbi:MRN complex-interacting protein [Asparagus officinalis]|uniref:MRN complex-interacting protein n=1 Tax=Asparagus officinalis TaxID=4686 RepID=UPI00098E18ED|nr:MRN complex-interacting protein [Asparagus officinalis]